MTENNEEDETEVVHIPRVGEQLRTVREEKKLTIAEVASQLRLVRGNIELLEQGKWEQLHGRAYARGYFTSYVKFLGLPEEEMLEAFNAEYAATVDEAQPRIGHEKKRGGLAGYILGLLGLALLAWFSYPQWRDYIPDEIKGAESVGQANQEQAGMPLRHAMAIDTPVKSEIQSVVEPIEDIVERNMEDKAPAASVPEGETVPESGHNNSASAGAQVDKTKIEESQANPVTDQLTEQAVTEIRTEQESESEPEIKQAEQNSVLDQLSVELSFSDDCWIKITDAEGKTLLNKLMPAQSRQIVTGVPPFNFSLGRSSAVSMKVNGKPFDMTPYQKREVVHFTVEKPVSS